jgi:prevent-host-death family protein
MQTFNIHEAKTYLSKLVDQAVQGEPFIIAKAGKPLVKVASIAAPRGPRRLGFMKGQFKVPKGFDQIGRKEIEALFQGDL